MRLEGVRKSFGDNLVLDGIDVTVAPGEVLTIIGLERQRQARCSDRQPARACRQRRIFLEGEEITRKCERNAIRQPIGIVFQQFNLFPHLKVIDNLRSGRRVGHVPRKEATKRAELLLGEVGLPEKAKSYPHQLSGGQQQRWPSPALMMSPHVMLFDEVTSALDPELVGRC